MFWFLQIFHCSCDGTVSRWLSMCTNSLEYNLKYLYYWRNGLTYFRLQGSFKTMIAWSVSKSFLYKIFSVFF